MVWELVPVMGFYEAMIVSGFSDYQINSIINGSTV